jgi:hypothetical protein
MVVELDNVVPWGRSLDEYQLMFAMTEADLSLRILGCGDGPASFNSEMAALGHRVTSIDPIYGLSRQQIQQRIDQTHSEILTQVRLSETDYAWKNFRDPDELCRHRLETMDRFLEDYEAGLSEGRYLPESLPSLTFEDDDFDLALCSHLLFLFSEQLSLDFHKAAIRELCRVAKEVRIFPLLALDCKRSVHVEPVISELEREGFQAEIVTVPYEIQRSGDQMMKISPPRKAQGRF